MNSTTDNSTRYLSAAIVEQLLDINKQQRARLMEQASWHCMTSAQLLREFYTVSLGTARQTGNTQIIYNLATENDWVFVSTISYKKKLLEKSPNLRIFTRHDFDGSVIFRMAANKNIILNMPQDDRLGDDIIRSGMPKRLYVDAASHFLELQNFTLSHKRFFSELSLFVQDTEIILIG